jgi:hypothetical protein
VTANDFNDHSSLIVGCRGGSGNFGVVTKFKFRAFKLPKYCHAGAKVFLTPTLASPVDVCRNADALLSEAPDNCTWLLVSPAGTPAVATLWGCFDDRCDHTASTIFVEFVSYLTVFSMQPIPILSKASMLGGWFTIEDSVKPVSYHNDLQRMTARMIVSGHVCTTLVQIGSIDKPLPTELFQEILGHTRKRLPSTLESAVYFLSDGRKDLHRERSRYHYQFHCAFCSIFAIIETRWKPGASDAGRVDARNWSKESSRILAPYSLA